MKIVEAVLSNITGSEIFCPNVKLYMIFFISNQFSPQGASWRLSYATLLRACNRQDYGFALKCLAYESLQLVQATIACPIQK